MIEQGHVPMITYYEPVPIYNSRLDVKVIYCSADAEEVDEFAAFHGQMEENEYIHHVLLTFIANWEHMKGTLKSFSNDEARIGVQQLYNGCVMLNPALDEQHWDKLVGDDSSQQNTEDKAIEDIISVEKFRGLKAYLQQRIVGQDHVIDEVCEDLKRTVGGLNDESRPVGVFMFAGTTGSGKSQTAKLLHEYLFSEFGRMIRIDCGEYQHKHENQKLIGSPHGFIGSDEGGYLTNKLKENNRCVLLFDEVEKAHPDIWHTLLRAFDEGVINDNKGNQYSLAHTLVVMTTNLGMQKTMHSVSNSRVGFTAKSGVIDDGVQPSHEVLKQNVDDAIAEYFPSEFINRIDKTIVFNVLTESHIRQIAEIELGEVDRKLSQKGVSLNYNDSVVDALTQSGVHVAEGARRVTRQRREKVENAISDAILGSDQLTNGSVIDLVYDEGYQATVRE